MEKEVNVWNAIENELNFLVNNAEIFSSFIVGSNGDILLTSDVKNIVSNELELMQFAQRIAPNILSMSQIELKRTFYQTEIGSVYFSKINNTALLGCIIGERFDFLNIAHLTEKAGAKISYYVNGVTMSSSQAHQLDQDVLKDLLKIQKKGKIERQMDSSVANILFGTDNEEL